MDTRDFKGIWIPKEIWLSKELSILDKVLLSEISSLSNDVDNEYFAEFCGCSVSSVIKSIKKLNNLGLIKHEVKNNKSENSKKNINIYSESIELIVDYLNSKANTSYRSSSNKTRTFIKARLNEGFKLQDFQKVIDTKCAEWLGTDMEKYLRPETLFGNKFENYLNQKTTNKNNRVQDIFDSMSMYDWGMPNGD